MWSQKVKDAIDLWMALVESALITVIEVVGDFISEYRLYILVGFIILIILVILDLGMKWQDKREKKRIDAEIEEQMLEQKKDQIKEE